MMDEIQELKAILGPAAQEYNDTQLRHLSREIDLVAQFLLDLYALRTRGAKDGQNLAF